MLKRILTALVLLPIVGLCIWFNNAPLPLFAILLTVACELGLKEFYDISEILGHKPNRVIGHVSVALLIFSYYYTVVMVNWFSHYSNAFMVSFILMAVIAAVTICWMLRSNDLKEGLNSCAWTLFGIIYMGLLPSFFVYLGAVEQRSGTARKHELAQPLRLRHRGGLVLRLPRRHPSDGRIPGLQAVHHRPDASRRTTIRQSHCTL